MIAHAVAHPPPDTAPALVRSAVMTDTAVTPRELVVAPGTAVAWVNAGRDRHTVSEDAGLFESGTLVPGERFQISAPAAPGVYAYHCRFHAYIRGTLTVSVLALETPAAVTSGGRPALSGTVPGAPAGTPVRVERRSPDAWEEVGTASTGADGGFRLIGPPLTTRTAFRAVAGPSLSPSVRAEVRPAVTLRRRGARVTVRVRPVPHRGRAHLERLDLDRYVWRRVAGRPLAAGRAVFRLPAPGPYRVAVDPHGGLSGAASRVVEFRPAAYRE